MLRELFDAVVALGRDSLKIDTHKPAAEPGHVYLLREANGKITRCDAEPQPRQHKALSLEPIVTFCEHFRGAPTEAAEPQHIAVWYSRVGVVALLDDATRRDSVTMALASSPVMSVLGRLGGKLEWHSQAEFIRLLRIDLAGCVDPALVGVVRKLKFRENAQGHSEVSAGKQSLGRSIERELTGCGSLPEELLLGVPVWTGFLQERRFAVKCVTDIEPAAEKFTLCPLPGELEKATRAAEEALGAMLANRLGEMEHVSVYYGVP